MNTRRLLLQLAAVTEVIAWVPGLHAQILADPMRPPPGMRANEPAETPARGPVLQSIVIRRDGRFAIISGQRVREHERFGDSTVERIGEDEVVLRTKSGRTVLKLYPDVNIKPEKAQERR